jgi:glutamate synthase domain-containing protein 3
MDAMVIDTTGILTKDLSGMMRESMLLGVNRFCLTNVCGQRYIGTRLYSGEERSLDIDIAGTPGSDLGAFMKGHNIRVHGNVQEGVGNTMDDGLIVIEGRAGDVLGLSMRGGKIFVGDGTGYRTALHMKEYEDKIPMMVIGGTSQDFLGEYMAGGVVVLLDLENGGHDANFIGTGMHGGVIFLRGTVEESQVGSTVQISKPDDADRELLDELIREFLGHFPGLEATKEEIMAKEFVKLSPVSKRPYMKMYAY